VLALHEPVGVVGVVCPERWPLLGFVSLVAPLVAAGNPVVALPSEGAPLAAWDLVQVIETSDVPAGVINVVTGHHAELVPHLAGHDGVDMVWHAGDPALAREVETLSAGNLKRTWCPTGFDPTDPRATDEELLRHATRVKNLWLPHGV
jgi:aldehyde dehydrogenase (NAD+)